VTSDPGGSGPDRSAGRTPDRSADQQDRPTLDGRELPRWLVAIAERFERVFDIVDAIWDLPVVRGFMGWIAVLAVNIGLAMFLDEMTGSVPWFPGAWQDATTGMVVLVCLLIFRAIYSPQAARAELERRRRAELRKAGLTEKDVDPVRDAAEEAAHLKQVRDEMGDGMTPHKKRAIFYALLSAAAFSIYLALFMQCVIEDSEWESIERQRANEFYVYELSEYEYYLDEYNAMVEAGEAEGLQPPEPPELKIEDHRVYVPILMPESIKEYLRLIREEEGKSDAFADVMSYNRGEIQASLMYDNRHYVALTSIAFFWAYLLFTSFATASFAYLIAPEDFALDVTGIDAVFG